MKNEKLSDYRRWRLRAFASLAVLACSHNATAFAQDVTVPSQRGEWEVGHHIIQADTDTGANRPMDINVWFPTDADTTLLGPARYGDNRSRWAFETDQAISGEQLPLIVWSHGGGGVATQNTILAESLASNGFVVAAVTHIDDWRPANSFERVHDVSSIIDVLLAANDTPGHPFNGLINGEAIGMVGHSFGGSTALTSVTGYEYETYTLAPDGRVRAIIPIAQGDLFGQDPDLSKVDVPTMLLVGNADDFGGNLLAPDELASLGSSDKFLAIIDGADHLGIGASVSNEIGVVDLPALGVTMQKPYALTSSNDDILNATSILSVSFFSHYLKDDFSYDDVLLPSYAIVDERLAEYTVFVDGQLIAVPEPGTFLLAAIALAGISWVACVRRRADGNTAT